MSQETKKILSRKNGILILGLFFAVAFILSLTFYKGQGCTLIGRFGSETLTSCTFLQFYTATLFKTAITGIGLIFIGFMLYFIYEVINKLK